MTNKYPQMASKAWKLEEREGRGCCLVANKSLLPGELVLSEEPLFTIRAEDHDSDLDQCLENALGGLKAEKRLAFFSLADSRASLSNSKKTARGIYFTNCYTLGQTRDSPAGMFLVFSRANHSCRPNCEFHWCQQRGVQELRANRCIEDGEELTDCYLDLSVEGRITRAERQKVLLGAYGFQCSCQACNLDQEDVEKEDQLRREAWLLTQPKACRDDELLSRAERLLHIRVQLQFKLALQLDSLAVVWALALLAGQEDRARQVAEQGEATAIIRFGSEHAEVRLWKRRATDPMQAMMEAN